MAKQGKKGVINPKKGGSQTVTTGKRETRNGVKRRSFALSPAIEKGSPENLLAYGKIITKKQERFISISEQPPRPPNQSRERTLDYQRTKREAGPTLS